MPDFLFTFIQRGDKKAFWWLNLLKREMRRLKRTKEALDAAKKGVLRLALFKKRVFMLSRS